MSNRFFVGVVVPILYVLALAVAVLCATASGHHARPGWTPAAAKLDVRADAHAVRRPARHLREAARRPAKRAVYRVARRPVVHRAIAPTPPPTPPPISRSSERIETPVRPNPVLVVRIASVVTPATMQSAINACQGPVEILWSTDPFQWGSHPDEIAEHDYCGGTDFSSLAAGQQVQVIGGNLTGLYVVNGNRRFAGPGSSADLLDGMGAVVLQTCVPDGVVLVGLDRTT